jgi:hypothetical protein
MSINQLKSLNTDKYDLDELVALSAEGKALQAEYAVLGADEPEWLGAAVRALARDIRVRQADAIEKRLRQARARVEALKPASERRAALEAQILADEARIKTI